jgi:putative ABC transport system substrate-binding protein
MTRLSVVASLTFALLAAPLAAEAQQAAKVARVGVLVNRPGDADEFRQAFGELGWAVGQNIVFEIRVAEDRFERLPGLARELVDLNVDVIMTTATPATLAAKNATKTIPIIFTFWPIPWPEDSSRAWRGGVAT